MATTYIILDSISNTRLTHSSHRYLNMTYYSLALTHKSLP